MRQTHGVRVKDRGWETDLTRTGLYRQKSLLYIPLKKKHTVKWHNNYSFFFEIYAISFVVY